jgi:uncharacterized protein (DUF1015 family)
MPDENKTGLFEFSYYNFLCLLLPCMSIIKPFRAIRPNPLYADQLVFTLAEHIIMFDNEQADEVLPPLKTALESGARARPETPDGLVAAYADILQNLQNLLTRGKLLHEEEEGIYVYEIAHKTYRQTGIWALTALDDYTGGTIKIHELTFADSVRRLKNYRGHTGLEGSPVLLTYKPDVTINRIIAETRTNRNGVTMGTVAAMHTLWKIEDEAIIKQLISAFARVRTAYLADGHHRLGAAAKIAAEQRADGLPVFDTISSLYIATDQLRIREYDRVYLPEQTIDKQQFLRQIAGDFVVDNSPGNKPVRPSKLHQMGMLLENNWYHLTPKRHTYDKEHIAGALDAGILQEHLLAPVFAVTDPGTDKRIKYFGGETAMDDLLIFTAEHPSAIAFTLCPLAVGQLMAVADAGGILPPKSTWIDPKIPYGLLLYQHHR